MHSILRFCAWIFNLMCYLPFRPIGMNLVERILLRAAWIDGYMSACVDLANKQSCMLECLSRYKCVFKNGFHPCRPNLVLLNPDAVHEWNMGYERAIMLYRLHVDPYEAFKLKLPMAVYGILPCSFDAQLRCILDGELKEEPRRWCTVTGQTLIALEVLETLLREEYEAYSIRVQQIRGGYSSDVAKDMEKL